MRALFYMLAFAPLALAQTKTVIVLRGLDDANVESDTGTYYGSIITGDATVTTYAYHCVNHDENCDPKPTATITAGPSTVEWHDILRPTFKHPERSETFDDNLTYWLNGSCTITRSATAVCQYDDTVVSGSPPRTSTFQGGPTTATRNEMYYIAITVTDGLSKISTGATAKPTNAPGIMAAGVIGLGLGAL